MVNLINIENELEKQIMFDFNEAVELALKTWYPKDHELHSNPHHPLGKLLGEWGELLDDYMKSLYKPGYEFEPLDELGDIWYYLRILCYQKSNYESEPIEFAMTGEADNLIAITMYECSLAIINYYQGIPYSEFMLDICYTAMLEICKRYDITLDQLTASNWEKLKPGSERGNQWMKARVNTNYIGGKVAGK
jgi:hypothetical protein